MAVDSHIARVLNQELRLSRILCRRILPSVRVLQLEIGIALHLTKSQSQSVVLTDITIAPYPRAVLCKQSFVVLLGDHIDDASDGILAI